MPSSIYNLKSLLDSGKSICYLCGDQIAAFPILALISLGFLCSYQG